jgi:hypothetical protein
MNGALPECRNKTLTVEISKEAANWMTRHFDRRIEIVFPGAN